MMADSHDTTQLLEQGDLEEKKEVAEVSGDLAVKASPIEIEGSSSEDQQETVSKLTKEDVLKRLSELVANVENVSKQDLDSLKQTFYKLHNAELEVGKKQFVKAGGTAEDYAPDPDKREDEFKKLMTAAREKRIALIAKEEKHKDENLKSKLSIIERLKELVETSEDANRSYNDFKRLQQEWNEIRQVPQSKVEELWRNYQLYVEKFYDILKLSNEFRDYDFKKNLEIKTKLCEAAERLVDEPDAISAFHQLQKLHQEFRDTGPVVKELRNDVWDRFKAASKDVNRRHQQHFDQLKEVELQNLDQKTVICEIVEAIDYASLTSFTTWEEKTQEVIALQNKWKTIGFAPQKMNVKIFERFRKACDEFFLKKGEHFRGMKDEMNENLKKKEALCEKAEALKDSLDWKETSDVLVKLQKEWKTIGTVPRKYSDVIWRRFITACDYFFEQKNKATSSQHSEEVANMTLKKALIEKLAAIDESVNAEETERQIHALIKEWGTIGHVPFKEKDKLYKEFHDLVDKHFERLNLNASNKKLNNFKSSLSGIQNSSQSLYREREKLVRTRDYIKNDIQVYENNLGFFTSSSKKGESLLVEANRKIEKLKGDLELVTQKIKVIDETIEKED
ncbi:hypothetical protein EZS27_023501 [termite gut metagenome]|uniref:DUF349 domain-containing protein n=1 Tax=termite gut metagenome TaxID=433724 RepID=A0A5J4R2H0_9ZZZZ